MVADVIVMGFLVCFLQLSVRISNPESIECVIN